MPRGIPNTKKTPAAVALPALDEPAPMIFIEPVADGIRLNAYGLEASAIMDALRRVLLHLAAQRAGVQVISLEVPARAAVAASPAAPARAAMARPQQTPSRRATNGRALQTLREQFGEDVEVMSLSALGLDEDD